MRKTIRGAFETERRVGSGKGSEGESEEEATIAATVIKIEALWEEKFFKEKNWQHRKNREF